MWKSVDGKSGESIEEKNVTNIGRGESEIDILR